jgi:hypothetical protein
MLRKRLNKDDTIAYEILDNIFVQVNSMSELVSHVDYLTNTDSNSDNNDVYNVGNIVDDDVSNSYYNDNGGYDGGDTHLVSTDISSPDMNDEIWLPVKEEVDLSLTEDENNMNSTNTKNIDKND